MNAKISKQSEELNLRIDEAKIWLEKLKCSPEHEQKSFDNSPEGNLLTSTIDELDTIISIIKYLHHLKTIYNS